jgi:hypothetical protein
VTHDGHVAEYNFGSVAFLPPLGRQVVLARAGVEKKSSTLDALAAFDGLLRDHAVIDVAFDLRCARDSMVRARRRAAQRKCADEAGVMPLQAYFWPERSLRARDQLVDHLKKRS